MKKVSENYQRTLLSWCKSNGIDAVNPDRKKFLNLIVKETAELIDEYEKIGLLMVPKMELDGTTKFYSLEDARKIVKEFKSLYGLTD